MGTVHSVLGRPEAQQNTYKSYFKILKKKFAIKIKPLLQKSPNSPMLLQRVLLFKETNKVVKNGRDHPTLLIKVCSGTTQVTDDRYVRHFIKGRTLDIDIYIDKIMGR